MQPPTNDSPNPVASPNRSAVNPITKAAMSVAEWCAFSGLGVTTTYELIKEGRLKSFKVGRRRLIRIADAEAFLASSQS